MRNRLLSVLLLAVTSSLIPAGATMSAAESIDPTGTVYAGMYSSEFFSTDDLNGFSNAAGKRMTFGGTFHQPTKSSPRATNSCDRARKLSKPEETI